MPDLYLYMEGGPFAWRFEGKLGRQTVQVSGNFSAENGVPLYQDATLGLGIAIQPDFRVHGFDDKGMVYFLEEHCRAETGIYAVYPSTRKLPVKTRVFIDFLIQQLETR